MEMNLVLRAADPAGAAATLSALGIPLESPNRPNPERWHAWVRVAVSIEQCPSEEQPSIALGVTDLRHRLSVLPPGAVSVETSGAIVVDAGGARLRVREDDGLRSRPAGDQQSVLHAEVIIRDARAPAIRRLRRTLRRQSASRRPGTSSSGATNHASRSWSTMRTTPRSRPSTPSSKSTPIHPCAS